MYRASRRRSGLSIIGVSAVFALTLTACSPPGSSSSSEDADEHVASTDLGDEPIELRLWDGAGRQQLDDALIAGFEEAYPNITITATYDPDNVSAQNGPRIVASDDAPDLVRVTAVTEAVAGGHLTNLDDYSELYGWDAIPSSQLQQSQVGDDGLRGHGSLYAIPAGFTITGVFYNKELAAQAGMTETPTTVAELEAVFESAAAAGLQPIMASNKAGNVSYAYQNLFNDLAGLDAVQDWIFQQPDATIDTPEAVEAAEIFQGWVEAGYYPEGVNGIDYTTALGRFASGEGVFYFSGNWDVATLQEGMGDNVGFFAAPPVDADGTISAMTSPTTPFGIPTTAENKDAAAAFLDWLTSDEARKIQADQGYPPVGAADATPPAVEEGTVNAEVQTAFSALSEANALVDFVNNATAGIQSSAWVPNLQLLVSGELTPEAFATAMQSAYEDELGR